MTRSPSSTTCGSGRISAAAALGAGVPEMQHFARELFHLARRCGAAGLAPQSKRLFELAVEGSGPRGSGFDFRLYRLLATLVGWRAAGKAAMLRERVR